MRKESAFPQRVLVKALIPVSYTHLHSNANATYSGYVEDIATRSAGATAPQTFEYTLGVPGQNITDLQGFVIDPATVTYDLSDTDLSLIHIW